MNLLAALDLFGPGYDPRILEPEAEAPKEKQRIPVGDGEVLDAHYGGATAMVRGEGDSVPIRFWEDQGLLQGEVLDLGSGKETHRYEKYDPFHNPNVEALLKSYDTVMCNYVLQVQPAEHLVDQLIVLARRMLRPGGRGLFSVRNDITEDSYSARGFQRALSWEEWAGFFRPAFSEVERARTDKFYGFICT